jgi:O-antigen ligase
MLRVVQAGLVTIIVVFLPQLAYAFELPKADIVRMLGIGMLVAIAASPAARRRIRLQPLDVAISAWLAVELLSTVFSRLPAFSALGDVMLHEGLLTSLGLAGLYAGTRYAVRRPEHARRVLGAGLIGVAIACAYALLQVMGLDPAPWAGGQGKFGNLLRPVGTLGQANVLGATTAAATVLVLGAALAAPRSSKLRWLAAALFLGVTLLTVSRSAWIGLAAGLVVLAAVQWRSRVSGSKRLWWGMAVALAVIVVLLIVSGRGGVILQRLTETWSPETGSARSRWEIWRSGFAAWRARPLLGNGPDTFAQVSTLFQTPEYLRFEVAAPATQAHNIYLHSLATRGVLGFLSLIALAVTFVVASRSAWRDESNRPWIAGMVAGWIAFSLAGVFGTVGNAGAALLAVIAACMASLAERTTEPHPVPPPENAAAAKPAPRAAPASRSARVKPKADRPRDRGATGIRAGAVWAGIGAGAVVLAWSANEIAVSGAVGDGAAWARLCNRADDPSRLPGYVLTVEQLRVGTRSVAYHDGAPRELAELMLCAAQHRSEGVDRLLAEATTAAREAVRRAPLRVANDQRLADALVASAQRGRPELGAEAESVYRRAAGLAPNDGLLRVAWAGARLAMGHPAEALEPAREASRLYPSSGHAWAAQARIFKALGDSAAADSAARRAIAGDWYGDVAGRQRLASEMGLTAP